MPKKSENKKYAKLMGAIDYDKEAAEELAEAHLGRIMMHLLRNGRPIPRAIRGEATRRSIAIPSKVSINWGSDDEKQLIESDVEFNRGY